MAKKNLKVGYFQSYKTIGYVRGRVLTNALKEIENVELFLVINKTKSLWRYIETLGQLIKLRLKHRPDVYILGFRGQELYWPVRLVTIGKPLIFDEFINMHDWLGAENNKLPGFLIKLADLYETLALKTCRYVLTDTNLGAKSSSEIYKIPLAKYRTIYVGTDETIFHPKVSAKKRQDKTLEVFFYGNMAPLHGLKYILEAASKLKQEPIHFRIIGGRGKPEQIKEINDIIESNQLTNVSYEEWINFYEIPTTIAYSDIFLSGPYGDTSQSKRVITGKAYQSLAMAKATLIGRINEEAGFIDKVNCILVDQGSSDKIADALTWCLKNKGQLEAIGQEGYLLYIGKFSTSQAAGQLTEILNSLESRE